MAGKCWPTLVSTYPAIRCVDGGGEAGLEYRLFIRHFVGFRLSREEHVTTTDFEASLAHGNSVSIHAAPILSVNIYQ